MLNFILTAYLVISVFVYGVALFKSAKEEYLTQSDIKWLWMTSVNVIVVALIMGIFY